MGSHHEVAKQQRLQLQPAAAGQGGGGSGKTPNPPHLCGVHDPPHAAQRPRLVHGVSPEEHPLHCSSAWGQGQRSGAGWQGERGAAAGFTAGGGGGATAIQERRTYAVHLVRH